MIAYRQVPQSEYATPTIVLLREHLETIRSGEIDRARRRMGGINAEQEMAIESLTRSIIDEILDGPITVLKGTSVDEDRVAAIEGIRRIFDLGEKHKREIRTPLRPQLSAREVAR